MSTSNQTDCSCCFRFGKEPVRDTNDANVANDAAPDQPLENIELNEIVPVVIPPDGNPPSAADVLPEEVPSDGNPPSSRSRWMIRFLLISITIIYLVVGSTLYLADHNNFFALLQHLTLNDLRSSAFVPLPPNSSWVGADSLLHFDDTGALLLYNVTASAGVVYLRREQARPETVLRTQLSGDRSLVLLERLTYDGEGEAQHHYDVFPQMQPTNPNPQPHPFGAQSLMQYAEWGPNGTQLAFVRFNDLHYAATLPTDARGDSIKMLSNSGHMLPMAHWQSTGVAPPAYGRHILHDDRAPASNGPTLPQVFPAFWFSPNGRHLAAAEFNASQLSINSSAYAQPVVRLFVWDLTVPLVGSSKRKIDAPAITRRYDTPTLLTIVQWAMPGSDPDAEQRLVSVWSNRLHSEVYVMACSVATPRTTCMKLVKLEDAPVMFPSLQPHGGFIDLPLPILLDDATTGRLLLNDASHVPHNYRLYAYANRSAFDASEHMRTDERLPHSWTSAFGDDVHIERLLHWDNRLNVVFVLATWEPNSEQRHLFAVVLALGGREPVAGDLQCLTCNKPGYTSFEARFPTHAAQQQRYLILEWQGPNVPLREVCEWSLEESPGKSLGRVKLVRRYTLNRFDRMRQQIGQVGWLLSQVFVNMQLQGHPWPVGDIRVKLTFRTHMFADRTDEMPRKTPLLVIPSDGADTDAMTSAFSMDFGDFMALERSVLVVRIDGAGRGRNGAPFRHLGLREVQDILAVIGHILASPVYGVDHERVAIWGHHGYGGYLAGMALAIDKGRLLRCGVAGAPILNWHESEFVSDQYLGVHHADEIMNNMTSLLSNGANIPDHALLLIHGQRSDERRQTKELARRLELDDVRFESLNYQKNGKQFDYPYEGVVKFLDRCLANECVDEQD